MCRWLASHRASPRLRAAAGMTAMALGGRHITTPGARMKGRDIAELMTAGPTALADDLDQRAIETVSCLPRPLMEASRWVAHQQGNRHAPVMRDETGPGIISPRQQPNIDGGAGWLPTDPSTTDGGAGRFPTAPSSKIDDNADGGAGRSPTTPSILPGDGLGKNPSWWVAEKRVQLANVTLISRTGLRQHLTSCRRIGVI